MSPTRELAVQIASQVRTVQPFAGGSRVYMF